MTGYQKRTADKGIEKIQDDIMALHEAYQFLMKKYKYVDINVSKFFHPNRYNKNLDFDCRFKTKPMRAQICSNTE